MEDTPGRRHTGGGLKGAVHRIKNKSSGALECC